MPETPDKQWAASDLGRGLEGCHGNHYISMMLKRTKVSELCLIVQKREALEQRKEKKICQFLGGKK